MRITCGKCVFFAVLFIFIFFAMEVYADTVYLKNGRKIEGIVVKESGNAVSLNVGFGLIELERDQIDRIEKGDIGQREALEQEWGEKYFMRSEYVPEKLRDLGTRFRKLENARNKASRAKRKQALLDGQIKNAEKKLTSLNMDILPVSKALSAAEPRKDALKYNKLVAEYNYISAQMKIESDRIKNLRQEFAETALYISDYYRKFRDFSAFFFERISSVGKDVPEDEAVFLKKLEKTLKTFDNDFQEYQVQYNRFGKDIVVTAILNDSVVARLVVDTGATQLSLSPRIARQLGIPVDSVEYTAKVRLADDRLIEVYPFVLKSVSVGDAKAVNVNAHVGKSENSGDYDGLLGMSFLENFIFKIDSSRNRIVFEKFVE